MCVENDDGHPGLAGLQLIEEKIGGICLALSLGFVTGLEVDRDEVVLAVQFHAVARVVKQSNITSTDSFDKGVDRALKSNAIQVLAGLDLEIEATKSSGYRACIVDRVLERSSSSIVRIADNQCSTGRRRSFDYHTANGGLRLSWPDGRREIENQGQKNQHVLGHSGN